MVRGIALGQRSIYDVSITSVTLSVSINTELHLSEDQSLLIALLDCWDRNNTILLGLLVALPEGGLAARALAGSPTVAELLTHLRFVRVCTVYENDAETAETHPELTLTDDQEWVAEQDPEQIRQALNDSALVVRDAVERWVDAGRRHVGTYQHPVLLLQHLLWHEAYHTGQIKLALKAAGLPMTDAEAGPVTWDVWRRS
ncbi:DinB family protein [Deinococcus sp.]|uniref:DinB family protein n=1 Tax=Deinococcus sp. TaxID=47478 RepID=UPI003CC63DBE